MRIVAEPITSQEAVLGRRRRWRRGLGFLVYGIVVGVLLAEILARVLSVEKEGHLHLFGMKLLPFALVPEGHAEILNRTQEECPYVVPDPELGWTIKPHGRHPKGLFAANGLGLRSAPAEAAAEKPAGVARVLLAGDSFTHGDEIAWEDTWSARLGPELGPTFEVWNGGVPGYGADQAYLRALRLRDALHPDVAVLSICRDDLLRDVNLFRALYHHWTDFPWSKPRFVPEGEGLRLVNVPTVPPDRVEATLRDLGHWDLARFDICWRPSYYTDDWRDASRLWRWWRSREEHRLRYERLRDLTRDRGEGVVVTARIARRFADDMSAAGVRPVVILIPQFDDLPNYKPGGLSPLRFVAAEMGRLGLRPVDLGPAFFRDLGPGEDAAALYVGGAGHPNARACRVIARELAPVVRGP